MGYREMKVGDAPGALLIEPGHGVTRFDLDYFGLDDGHERSPDPSFRAIFQLGSGYMIYLYVIGLRQPGQSPWFHTFWIKDCAVAAVGEEELGAPSKVECAERELPLLYTHLVLEDRVSAIRTHRVGSIDFRAWQEGGEQALELRFTLIDDQGGSSGELTWRNGAGWTLAEGESRRALRAGERVTFRGLPS
jgi:hypothetical protein